MRHAAPSVRESLRGGPPDAWTSRKMMGLLWVMDRVGWYLPLTRSMEREVAGPLLEAFTCKFTSNFPPA
jgi:hypothetical protein